MGDLPVGFRFYPTEEELLCYYLPNKQNAANPDIDRVIPLLNIYDYNPWELPQHAGEVCRGDREQWFFFTAMQEREARGGRPNRLTEKGYWKATGSPSDVFTCRNHRIGRKKTMVFYEGRAPHGSKTTWKMNEYKVYDQSSSAANPQLKEELSLCRIYKRSKCTRGFDRRPADEAATQCHSHRHRRADVAFATSDDRQNNPTVGSEVMSWDIANQSEPLWDSEDLMMLLNWFDL
ncbi:NAC domain-containing protein 90-like [Salvia divinorum]|uniref:NAC domain-containing protein 90-like n=1 Tax=Salvia divinorum TaxID=28513 RepID=A0ABD1ICJ9_SALDI